MAVSVRNFVGKSPSGSEFKLCVVGIGGRGVVATRSSNDDTAGALDLTTGACTCGETGACFHVGLVEQLARTALS
jgi:hypothetical protein